MNGVNIEIPHNRNIFRITAIPHFFSRRQMESSHGWIEMSFNGFSCYVNSSVVSPLFIISVSQLPPGLKFLAEMNKKPPA